MKGKLKTRLKKGYYIGTSLLFLTIMLYIFITSKNLESVAPLRSTQYTEQQRDIPQIQTELTRLYAIRSEQDWENAVKQSKMTRDLKVEVYGNQYDLLYYSKDPKMTIIDIGYTAEKPYSYLVQMHITYRTGQEQRYVLIKYEQGYITDFKII